MEEFKIKKVSAVDQVFKKLKEAIHNKQWEDGEKIPSESELADMYGVNRLTIRLALQQLNLIGVLETKVGEGTFVKKFNFLQYLDQASDFWKEPELLNDVCEFRTAIELQCFKLAVRRATPEDIHRLDEAYRTFKSIRKKVEESDSCEDELFDQLARADFEYHYIVCDISGNSLLRLAYEMAKKTIIEYMKMQVRRRISQDKGSNQDSSQEWHGIILRSLENRDYEEGARIITLMNDYKRRGNISYEAL